ncbi:putative phage abortive infection protein [Butyricimonas virosa]|uniref:putative phage abortive infection protein n=1 Tax=Butyricimonas virosa TaxID=544645 RepID=UPI00242BB9E8|nr:putative phage abortive infection protein [Butyricimonas virosa]
MSFNEKNNFSLKNTVIFISILGIILCIGSVFCFSRPCIFDFFDLSNKGEIGSAIGGMTAPILNLIGAILIYCSFYEQSKANQIQRKALEEQRKLQLKQQLENCFFQLLTNFSAIVRDMDIQSSTDCSTTHSGRDCFKFWNKELNKYFFNNLKTHKTMESCFTEEYEKYQHDLQPYFYNIFTILFYIDNYNIEDQTLKEHLVKIFRANLSDHELQLIYLTRHLPEFKQLDLLTKKYNFWENFTPHPFLNSKKEFPSTESTCRNQ